MTDARQHLRFIAGTASGISALSASVGLAARSIAASRPTGNLGNAFSHVTVSPSAVTERGKPV